MTSCFMITQGPVQQLHSCFLLCLPPLLIHSSIEIPSHWKHLISTAEIPHPVNGCSEPPPQSPPSLAKHVRWHSAPGTGYLGAFSMLTYMGAGCQSSHHCQCNGSCCSLTQSVESAGLYGGQVWVPHVGDPNSSALFCSDTVTEA